jgi:hypothetical protein
MPGVRDWWPWVLVAVFVAMRPVGAAAQKVAITPTIGIYAPTSDLVNAFIDGQEVVLKQKAGLALGGRIGVFFSPRFSVAITGTYVPSETQLTIDETGVNQDDPTKTDLWFGSARLSFWVLPPTSFFSLGLSGGLGLAGRGETTIIDNLGQPITSPSTTDIGGVIGATAGINLGGIGLFIGVDDYIYNPTVFEEQGVKSKTQNDLQVSFGLGIPLGGKRR